MYTRGKKSFCCAYCLIWDSVYFKDASDHEVLYLPNSDSYLTTNHL